MDPKYTADKTASHTQPDTETAASDTTPTMQTVMEQLPLPRALKDWLVCVRKPAISLQYRIDKRHVPDLDAEPKTASDSETAGKTGHTSFPAAAEPTSSPSDTAAEPRGSTAESSADGGTSAKAAPASAAKGGQNTDLMTLSGGFTIRYFDLAVGMLGILMATCLFRGCCWIKRQLK